MNELLGKFIINQRNEITNFKKIYKSPKIHVKNWDEWTTIVNKINFDIREGIHMMINNEFENFSIFEGIAILYWDNVKEVIFNTLYELTKNKEWSERVSKEIINIININSNILVKIHIFNLMPINTLIEYFYQTVKLLLYDIEYGTGYLSELPIYEK